ncbi:MAG: hypothetical protein QM713_04715 [Arachnia sp.]
MTAALLAATLLLLGAAALGATNPLFLGTLALAVALAGPLCGARRRLAHRRAVALGLAALAWWLVVPVLLPMGASGTVLLPLPTWQISDGVALGGPVTSDGLLTSAVAGLRAFALCALFGVAWQALPGTRWWALARAALGRGAELVGPWCFLGDATVAAWHRRRAEASQGWPGRSGWGETFALARAAAHRARPADDPAWRTALRGLLLALLAALPVLSLAGAVPATLRQAWSPLDLALLPLLGLLALAATAADAGRPAWPLVGAFVLAVTWLGRPWLPGFDALVWTPADGWPGAPLLPLLAAVALPVALLLTEEGRDA